MAVDKMPTFWATIAAPDEYALAMVSVSSSNPAKKRMRILGPEVANVSLRRNAS